MATHRIPIFGFGTLPDNSGKVWSESYDVLATNDVWDRLIWRFDEDGNNNAQLSTRVGIKGGFTVPKNYVGTAKIIVVWTSTVTTGDIEFDFDYRAVGGDDTESLDQAGTQESVNLNDTAPSAAHERMEVALALTSANLAVDDEVLFELFMDGTDAGDTLAGARLVFAVLFEYADA